MHWTTFLLVILTADCDGQFIDNLKNLEESSCVGGASYLNWTYLDNTTSVLFVEWKVNGSRIALEEIDRGQPFAPAAGYIGRLSKRSNGQTTLDSLTLSDTGNYTCEITYTDFSGYKSAGINLHIFDILNEPIKIKQTPESGKVKLESSYNDEFTEYRWMLSDAFLSTKSLVLVAQNGNYTLCLSGGRADCLNPSVGPCTSTEVMVLTSCDYSDVELFMGGFSTFLIELAVFIVIMALLMWKIMIGDFTKLKVVVSCAFLLVALIIGIILGIVLLECGKRSLSLGLGLLLGFLVAAAHLMTICVVRKKCDKDTKKDEVERKGKAFLGNPVTINGNKVDSQKESPRPLPVPPANRGNQLEPIAPAPNDGATSSEKKKKKKKKKKKSVTREEAVEQ